MVVLTSAPKQRQSEQEPSSRWYNDAATARRVRTPMVTVISPGTTAGATAGPVAGSARGGVGGDKVRVLYCTAAVLSGGVQ